MQPGEDAVSEDAAVSGQLLAQITDDYVAPEVARRVAEGTWSDGDLVVRALVLLGGPRTGEVLLNDEVLGTVTIKAQRPMQTGDDVLLEDVARVENFKWEDDDGICSYVAVLPTGNGLALVTNFRGNVPESAALLDAAEEFMACALDALAAGRPRVYLDLAYSAVELLAKSELVRWAGTTVTGVKSHNRVRAAYNAWARRANTEQRFATLFNRLDELRGPARYLDSQIEVAVEELDRIATDLRAMYDHVRTIAPRPGIDPEPAEQRPLNAIARRDLRAGEMLCADDLSPFPPRARR